MWECALCGWVLRTASFRLLGGNVKFATIVPEKVKDRRDSNCVSLGHGGGPALEPAADAELNRRQSARGVKKNWRNRI